MEDEDGTSVGELLLHMRTYLLEPISSSFSFYVKKDLRNHRVREIILSFYLGWFSNSTCFLIKADNFVVHFQDY